MIRIKNLVKQATVLEIKKGGEIVGLTLRGRGEVTITDDQMTQDILIKSESGAITYTHVPDAQ